MKKVFIFSLIILGVSSIIGQVIVIRELVISFYGNEFFIGWILFSWLFWVGLGSILSEKIIQKSKDILKIFISCHLGIAVLLFLEITLIRLAKVIIIKTPGEIPDLIPSLIYGFFIISPFCFILGAQFIIAAKAWNYLFKKFKISYLLSRAYLYETLGFIFGGIIFTYFLIFLDEFRIASLLSLLNLLAAGLILSFVSKKLSLKITLFGFLIIALGVFLCSSTINFQTNSFRFPNQKLIETKNSIYGNIAVTKTKNQYNFYETGLLIGPDKEEIFNEYLIHFPLLWHSKPKKILLIGTGFNGAIGEILKHQPQEIYYLELDPELIKLTKKYISPLVSQLKNPKVKIFYLDGRYFLKTNQEKFDLIIANLPNPSTALINRFYTEEFFKEIKTHLEPSGIFSIYLSSSPNYLSNELKSLQASIYHTIKKVFSSVVILPEDNIFFIASDKELNYDSPLLIKRLKERNIKNNFVNEAYIKYRVENERVKKYEAILQKIETNLNKDQHPISYYYNLIYWVSYFHPKLAKILFPLLKIKFSYLLMAFLLFILLSAFSKKRVKSTSVFPLSMAIAGFSLMSAELIIIYGFQLVFGYLYYKIGLIITALMIGMTIGTLLGTKKIPKVKIKYLFLAHGLIVVFCGISLAIFWFLTKINASPSWFIESLFYSLALFVGGIVGFEFPIVNKLYLAKIKNASQKTGIIYGADLFGSCLGALLVSIFILPVFGVFQAITLLINLNLFVVIFICLSRYFQTRKINRLNEALQ